MTYVFEPPAAPAVPIDGEDARFPVHRIYCVGRNYAAHAREMGSDPDREPPFFFMKPADAVVETGAVIPYALNTDKLHYEIELVIAIGKGGVDIARDAALDHVFGYGVGLDMTRRDRQNEAKDAGRPWDMGKGFDRSAPLAPLHRADRVGHLSAGRIWLATNGVVKQDSNLNQMTWSVPEIVSILSRSWELRPGDLIYSGTPDKVGPVARGDVITGGVDGLTDIRLTIAA